MTPTPQRVIDRALTRVERNGDCIISLYSVGSHGYAQIGWNENGKGCMRLIHRVAWEAAHGLIPDEMTIDHICHNRRCLNVEHLRLLTNADNGRRNGSGRDFPVGWVCKNNHPASSQIQIQRRHGLGWTCKECLDEAKKRWAANNQDRIQKARREWVERNPERMKEIHRAYNAKRRAK